MVKIFVLYAKNKGDIFKGEVYSVKGTHTKWSFHRQIHFLIPLVIVAITFGLSIIIFVTQAVTFFIEIITFTFYCDYITKGSFK